ncbi:SPOR domain-containing protein [Sphingomonas yunnanensis]|uniref:SPOR domain-containing protein n=1 Tax=Sphingomonas yunnanensis TaxID=310400 RepID=UPI001CA7293A|nr:SPOR domain-containing protein [Sphingomonas yunnanensis]MBY9062471.1 SPOR domain-containing protein [Sphingomonas yunnanensis]
MTDVPRPRPGRTLAIALAPLALAVALAAAPVTAARAQAIMPAANPEADRLAELVRRIGASPRDLSALVEAGELSFRLGDATAAAALYKRAEAIDPRNARVKGGIARILVNGERPGEALRYFDEAQRYGAVMARYADDRGLAYDLIGEQERAQRDYRLALAQGGAQGDELDELRRRYALSLGISGRQQEALAEIDALLRRSDRGAWRARAFILAMGGDVSGANRIATGMMPSGMAQGLAAFFQRLPTLNAADRAFAVHFGEVAPTPARLADARVVPVLPVLGADPNAPRRVEVAAVMPTAVAEKPLSRGEQRRRLKEAERQRQLAARATPAGRQIAARPVVATMPAPTPPRQVAAATLPTLPTPETASTTQLASAAPASMASAPTTSPLARPLSTASVAPSITRTPPAAMSSAAATPTTAPTPSASTSSAGVQVATAAPTHARPAAAAAPAAAPSPTPALAAARPAPPRLGEDSILARIVAGISVPGAELGVAPMPGTQRVVAVVAPPAPASTTVSASLDEAAQAAERNAAADEQKSQRLAAAKRVTTREVAAEDPAEPARARGRQLAAADKRKARAVEEEEAPVTRKGTRGRVEEEEAPVARKGARGRVAVDDEPSVKGKAAKKGASDRKLPITKNGEEDASAAKAGKTGAKAATRSAPKVEREEPARIWVQVAGGANPGDLGKAWKTAQGKAPALAGKRAYTAPLRATHRVVTGPFKTQAEARAMVNTLAKQGLSAFTFTSEAGQKVSRLDDQ